MTYSLIEAMEEIEKKSGEYPTEKKGCDCLVSIQFIYGFVGITLLLLILFFVYRRIKR